MARPKKKIDKNALPAVLLVHYKSPTGGYGFRMTSPEKVEETKAKLKAEGMVEISVPILEYRAKQLMEQGGVRE